jgi:hypothetical protein
MQDSRQQEKGGYASYYPITVKRRPAFGYGYGLALTRSLLLYAQHDQYFERIFLLRLLQLGLLTHAAEFPREPYCVKKIEELFILSNQIAAMQRMEWIIERTHAHDLPDTLIVERTLSSWGQEQTKEYPKAIVIGYVIGVVPPVGLGHVNRKKKMSLIVDHKISLDSRLMATYAAEASLGIVLEALIRAGGNTKKFEPEVADWFFGERAIEVYTTNELTLRTIKKELAELSAVHYILEKKEQVVAVAISPVVNSLVQEIYWDMERLEAQS